MEKIRNFLIARTRVQKTLIIIASDIFIFNFVFIYSNLLIKLFFNSNSELFQEYNPILGNFTDISIFEIFILNLLSISLIYFLKGYKSYFRANSSFSLIGKERIYGSFMFTVLLGLLMLQKTNNFVIALNSTFYVFILTCFLHFSLRNVVFKFLSKNISDDVIPILIYGAGQAGRETAAQLSQNSKYKVIGFIDDDKKIRGFRILGFKVLGGTKKLEKIKNDYPNILVVIAIVSILPRERKRIISLLEKYEIQVKTIPTNYGALETKLSINNLELSDLINRETSKIDENLSKKNIYNKSVLISGAGGSIGSEIVKQVAGYGPKKIICIDSSEFNLYKLKESFRAFKNFNNIIFILNDIKNVAFLERILEENEINTIFHAAAFKHVPILEDKINFQSAIENNFFATFNFCDLTSRKNIENFTLISSDKAVNPKNLMGATKRLSELSLQAFQEKKGNQTCFSQVRFGNVLNSSGSVVPLFWEQISSGGPITVTHEEINRFFMTIEEAASLVIQSSALSNGGEVFLLDMGNPVKIKDLAEKMIRLSGNSVAKKDSDSGIKIIFSGLRPGEKLYEELLLSEKSLETKHPKIKKGLEKKFTYEEIYDLKENLLTLTKENKILESKKLISNFVDGYSKTN